MWTAKSSHERNTCFKWGNFIWKPVSWFPSQITTRWFIYGNDPILQVWELSTIAFHAATNIIPTLVVFSKDNFPEKLFSSITYSPFKSFILLLKAEFSIVFNNLVKEKIPGISVKVGCNCKYYSCKTPTNQFSFFQSFYIFVSSITSEILIYIIRS